MRKERGSYKNPQTRRVTRLSSQGRANGPSVLTGPAAGSLSAPRPPALTPEQLIERIMEAEPPEIYLMTDMRRPLTEENVMMSLTNLADKELVHMISWAKKIPGECRGESLSDAFFFSLFLCCATINFLQQKKIDFHPFLLQTVGLLISCCPVFIHTLMIHKVAC